MFGLGLTLPLRNLRRPATSGGGDPEYDEHAADYIARVETADGEPLETAVKASINTLFITLKNTPSLSPGLSNWQALAGGILMAGPRTLAGALTVIKSDQPALSSAGPFVAEDYDRITGLKSSRTPSKSVTFNYPNMNLPRDDFSMAALLTEIPAIGAVEHIMSCNVTVTPGFLRLSAAGDTETSARDAAYASPTIPRPGTLTLPALLGVTRAGDDKIIRSYRQSAAATVPSTIVPASGSIRLFRWSMTSDATTARAAWSSYGRAVDLEALEAALLTYLSAISAALA